MMVTCAKCGELTEGQHLIGNRVVALCDGCASAWAKWIEGKAEWQQYREATTAVNTCVYTGALPQLPSLLADLEKAEGTLYELLEQWLKGHCV